MSIVVKGAKLPNNCGACPLCLAWCTERLYMVTRPERCPLEPERTGKWIKEKSRGQLYQCSACGNYLDFRGVNAGRGSAKFCPNCGARMES